LSKIRLDELKDRIKAAYLLLEKCSVCPRKCGVNRLKGERGFCQVGKDLIISSSGPHFGEENVLVGSFGSGAIFLTSCSLSCVFCQNYQISQLRQGEVVSLNDFATIMLSLEKRGCHNINFVTPTHFIPQILQAVLIAKEKGLNIPLVYNSSGYDSVEVLSLLEGVIDIYMPDAKYADEEVALRYSNAPNYPNIMKDALKQMHRQVGDLSLDEEGIAVRGLLVRHLVLPNDLAGTAKILHFLATEISQDTYVNIMDQYRPCFRAYLYPEVNRLVTHTEYQKAVELARKEGLHRGF
jgi:putative pyruvate formate lyase activating enzyme